MMKTFFATCVLVAVLCHHQILAEDLTLGSKAPKLELGKFVKGEEVRSFEKGKVYVIEMWATWCPPCRATIPHLTQIQKKFEDVIIIGVAVSERDQNEVAPFVEKMGEKMDYRVALDLISEDGDGEDGKTVTNWMLPAGVDGIPYAFIINGEGKIAWIGSPIKMEEPLEKIVAGKWDLVAEARKYAEEKQKIAEEKSRQEKLAAVMGGIQKLFEQFNDDGEPDELLAALESAMKEIPDQALAFEQLRFEVLSLTRGRTSDALDAAQKMLKSENGDDPLLLNNIAWIIVKPERDTKANPKLLKLALQVAMKADELTNGENGSVKDTLAKAYFDNGDLAKAVKSQESAVKLVEGTPMAQDGSLKKRLRQYKKALDAATTAPK